MIITTWSGIYISNNVNAVWLVLLGLEPHFGEHYLRMIIHIGGEVEVGASITMSPMDTATKCTRLSGIQFLFLSVKPV